MRCRFPGKNGHRCCNSLYTFGRFALAPRAIELPRISYRNGHKNLTPGQLLANSPQPRRCCRILCPLADERRPNILAAHLLEPLRSVVPATHRARRGSRHRVSAEHLRRRVSAALRSGRLSLAARPFRLGDNPPARNRFVFATPDGAATLITPESRASSLRSSSRLNMRFPQFRLLIGPHRAVGLLPLQIVKMDLPALMRRSRPPSLLAASPPQPWPSSRLSPAPASTALSARSVPAHWFRTAARSHLWSPAASAGSLPRHC